MERAHYLAPFQKNENIHVQRLENSTIHQILVNINVNNTKKNNSDKTQFQTQNEIINKNKNILSTNNFLQIVKKKLIQKVGYCENRTHDRLFTRQALCQLS